jgi:quinohemoprotein amine dehydrogenase beta subunit
MRASRFFLRFALCLSAVLGLSVAAGAVGFARDAQAKEYLLTGAKPDKLFLIDIKARKVARQYKIPDNSISPMTMVVAPNQKIVYVVTDHNKAISGINLESGDEVFHAELSRSPDERAINYALEVSPDGREIYSYELLTKLLPDRYDVQNPRISVYRTDAGIAARASKTFSDVPRRIHMLLSKKDGSKLYALGWDFYTLDPKTGKVLETYPLRHWKRPNASQPDFLNFWPLYDQTGVFMSLVTWSRIDLAPDNPDAAVTGLLTLDLKSGKFDVSPFKTKPEVLFTATLSPNRKEAFAAYTYLLKIDMAKAATVQRVPLDHSYYMVQLSDDGSEVYLGGTLCDIPIYAAKDLKKLGAVQLPGCPSMAGSPLKVVHW